MPSEEKSLGALLELTRPRSKQRSDYKVQALAAPGGNIRPALFKELKDMFPEPSEAHAYSVLLPRLGQSRLDRVADGYRRDLTLTHRTREELTAAQTLRGKEHA